MADETTEDLRPDRANPTDLERLQATLGLLRQAVGDYRASHGRDAVRALHWGHWLDALDAGRDSLHPDDAAVEDLTAAGLLAILDDVEKEPGMRVTLTYQRVGMMHKLDATVAHASSVEGFVEAWRHLSGARKKAVVEQLGQQFADLGREIIAAKAALGTEI